MAYNEKYVDAAQKLKLGWTVSMLKKCKAGTTVSMLKKFKASTNLMLIIKIMHYGLHMALQKRELAQVTMF